MFFESVTFVVMVVALFVEGVQKFFASVFACTALYTRRLCKEVCAVKQNDKADKALRTHTDLCCLMGQL